MSNNVPVPYADRPGLVYIEDNRAVTTSRKVATLFKKNHQHIMEAIRELIPQIGDFIDLSNFRQISYPDNYGREQPAYALTRDGFFLLAMGFTGRKALQFKCRFIAEFNRMETALRKQQPKSLTLADVEQLIDEKLSQIRALPPPDDEPKQPYYALVERFLAERVESAQGIITAAEVYNAFLAWCWNNSYLPLPKNSFGRAMTACGVERYRTASFKAYQGIKIKGE